MSGDDEEQWAPVRGDEDRYAVSTAGRVMSVRTGLLLVVRRGYVKLAGRRMVPVGGLVLEAFGQPRPSPRHVVLHDNGRDDCSLGSVRWGTNAERARSVLLRKAVPGFLTPDEVRAIRQRFAAGERRDDLLKAFDISRSELRYIVTGLAWGWLT